MKKQLFRLLPPWLKTELIRRSLDVSASLNDEIQFKIAETFSEFEQAFHLVHDAYVREGFISPQPQRLRVIPQHLLPSTHVLIAKCRDEVVGTLTLVRDAKAQLPLERVFDLNPIRTTGLRTAEITCLAVKSEYRRAKGGTVFANLMKYMYEFAAMYAGVDQLVVAVFPKDAIFYEGLLCFQALEKNPVDYLGAPAIALHLNLQQAPELFKKAYDWRAERNNLYRFFVEQKVTNFQFPKRAFCEINYPTFTPAHAERFFQDQGLAQVLPFRSRKHEGRSIRADVSCQGHLDTKLMETGQALKVLDVSMAGVKLATSQTLQVGQVYKASLQISPQHQCQISMEVRWTNQQGLYGLAVQSADPIWYDFVDAMTGDPVANNASRRRTA